MVMLPNLLGMRLGSVVVQERVRTVGATTVCRAYLPSQDDGLVWVTALRPTEDAAAFRAKCAQLLALWGSVRHPHILPLLDGGVTDRLVWWTTPVLSLTPLAELLAERALDPTEARDLVVQLAGALDAAHAHGLIHPDVGPGAVLLGARQRALLFDFGLALALRQGTFPGAWGQRPDISALAALYTTAHIAPGETLPDMPLEALPVLEQVRTRTFLTATTFAEALNEALVRPFLVGAPRPPEPEKIVLPETPRRRTTLGEKIVAAVLVLGSLGAIVWSLMQLLSAAG